MMLHNGCNKPAPHFNFRKYGIFLEAYFRPQRRNAMKKFILSLTLLLTTAIPLHAQVEPIDGYMPSQNLQEYFNADNTNYNKSIIYIFFNNEPCYTCATAIEMIENLYNREFIDDFNMFLINYQNDNENNFIETYQLSNPLEVVMVRINDGAAFGYKKIENLQNMTSDPVSFNDYLSNQIIDYLGSEY